ncbi:MAG: hypothetical protein K6A63_01680 [Acholeplasmatales bacterium]|nr:hypothetical protein [Acholeplasmatales bacterium]
MKKKSLTRKLITSIATATMTAVCLTTTTYAWFTTNQVAWTEETDFNLDFYSGLLISFDGVNFHQDVTKEELYQAITGLTDKTEAAEAYANMSFDGVTPLHDADGKVQHSNNDVSFVYDTVDKQTKTHTQVAATKNEKFIQFDLYFRIADGGTVTGTEVPSYNLVFTNDTEIGLSTYLKSKSGVQNVELVTSLTTMTKTYNAGETLQADGGNALRAGVQTYDSSSELDSFIVYEPVNEYNLGSAAIEGATDDLHNPAKNAMYTYYNNFFAEKFTEAAADGEAFDTHSSFVDGTSLGKFEGVITKDSNGNDVYKYNDVKITMYIWLEGWDADYFYGIANSNSEARTMQSQFVFTYEEV